MFVLLFIALSAVGGQSEPPQFVGDLAVSLASSTRFGARPAMRTSTMLWWSQSQGAWRSDHRSGNSQLIDSAIISYALRSVYLFSRNTSLCSVFCLPPSLPPLLPTLAVASNDTLGRTYAVSPGQWLRVTNVGINPSNDGRYNATVLTEIDLHSGFPFRVVANYSLHGDWLASVETIVDSYSPGRVDPALLVPPPQCTGSHVQKRQRVCFAPLIADPYAVAEIFYQEAWPPFGDNSAECSCF